MKIPTDNSKSKVKPDPRTTHLSFVFAIIIMSFAGILLMPGIGRTEPQSYGAEVSEGQRLVKEFGELTANPNTPRKDLVSKTVEIFQSQQAKQILKGSQKSLGKIYNDIVYVGDDSIVSQLLSRTKEKLRNFPPDVLEKLQSIRNKSSIASGSAPMDLDIGLITGGDKALERELLKKLGGVDGVREFEEALQKALIESFTEIAAEAGVTGVNAGKLDITGTTPWNMEAYGQSGVLKGDAPDAQHAGQAGDVTKSKVDKEAKAVAEKIKSQESAWQEAARGTLKDRAKMESAFNEVFVQAGGRKPVWSNEQKKVWEYLEQLGREGITGEEIRRINGEIKKLTGEDIFGACKILADKMEAAWNLRPGLKLTPGQFIEVLITNKDGSQRRVLIDDQIKMRGEGEADSKAFQILRDIINRARGNEFINAMLANQTARNLLGHAVIFAPMALMNMFVKWEMGQMNDVHELAAALVQVVPLESGFELMYVGDKSIGDTAVLKAFLNEGFFWGLAAYCQACAPLLIGAAVGEMGWSLAKFKTESVRLQSYHSGLVDLLAYNGEFPEGKFAKLTLPEQVIERWDMRRFLFETKAVKIKIAVPDWGVIINNLSEKTEEVYHKYYLANDPAMAQLKDASAQLEKNAGCNKNSTEKYCRVYDVIQRQMETRRQEVIDAVMIPHLIRLAEAKHGTLHAPEELKDKLDKLQAEFETLRGSSLGEKLKLSEEVSKRAEEGAKKKDLGEERRLAKGEYWQKAYNSYEQIYAISKDIKNSIVEKTGYEHAKILGFQWTGDYADDLRKAGQSKRGLLSELVKITKDIKKAKGSDPVVSDIIDKQAFDILANVVFPECAVLDELDREKPGAGSTYFTEYKDALQRVNDLYSKNSKFQARLEKGAHITKENDSLKIQEKSGFGIIFTDEALKRELEESAYSLKWSSSSSGDFRPDDKSQQITYTDYRPGSVTISVQVEKRGKKTLTGALKVVVPVKVQDNFLQLTLNPTTPKPDEQVKADTTIERSYGREVKFHYQWSGTNAQVEKIDRPSTTVTAPKSGQATVSVELLIEDADGKWISLITKQASLNVGGMPDGKAGNKEDKSEGKPNDKAKDDKKDKSGTPSIGVQPEPYTKGQAGVDPGVSGTETGVSPGPSGQAGVPGQTEAGVKGEAGVTGQTETGIPGKTDTGAKGEAGVTSRESGQIGISGKPTTGPTPTTSPTLTPIPTTLTTPLPTPSPTQEEKKTKFSGSSPGNWNTTYSEKGLLMTRKPAKIKGPCGWDSSVTASLWAEFPVAAAGKDTAKTPGDCMSQAEKSFKARRQGDMPSDMASGLFMAGGIEGANAFSIGDFQGAMADFAIWMQHGSWSDGGFKGSRFSANGNGNAVKGDKLIGFGYTVGGGGCWDNSDRAYLVTQGSAAQKEARAILASLKLDPNGEIKTEPYKGPAYDSSDLPKVVLVPSQLEKLKVGDTVNVQAVVENAKPEDSPFSYNWGGTFNGKPEDMKKKASVTIKPSKPGKYNLSVSVDGARFNLGSASLQYEVAEYKVKLERVPPENKPVPVGGKIKFKATVTVDGKETIGDLIFRWQPNTEVDFSNNEVTPDTKSPGNETVATFTKTGRPKIFIEILEPKGEKTSSTVAVSNQIEIEVIQPKLKLTANNKSPNVGDTVVLTVHEDPKMSDDVIGFWWEYSGNAVNPGPAANIPNSRAYSFKPKDTNPITVTVHAKIKDGKDDLGEEKATITAKSYNVTVTGPKAAGPKPQIWKCDTQLGGACPGLVEVEKGIAVHQRVEFNAEVSPRPETNLRYSWTVSGSSCTLSNPITRDVGVTCNETGSYVITATVRDKENIELGKGTGNLAVTISQEELNTAVAKAKPKVTVKADKTALTVGESVSATATADGGKSPYHYAWSGEYQGQGQSVRFSPKKPGDQTLSVEVTDAKGNKDSANITFKVDVLKVTIEGLRDEVIYGTKLNLSVTPENHQIVWRSEPAIGFTPQQSLGGKTIASFTGIGRVKVWAVAQQNTGAVIGESEKKEINVTPPKFEIIFDPPKGKVGDEITATVRTTPPMDKSLLKFVWESPRRSDIRPYDTNIVRFTPKNIVPLEFLVIAKEPVKSRTLAEIRGTYTAEAVRLDVVLKADKTRLKPGETTNIRADVRGGKTPYTFHWKGDYEGYGPTVRFHAQKSGQQRLYVDVIDTIGNRGSTGINIDVDDITPDKPNDKGRATAPAALTPFPSPETLDHPQGEYDPTKDPSFTGSGTGPTSSDVASAGTLGSTFQQGQGSGNTSTTEQSPQNVTKQPESYATDPGKKPDSPAATQQPYYPPSPQGYLPDSGQSNVRVPRDGLMGPSSEYSAKSSGRSGASGTSAPSSPSTPPSSSIRSFGTSAPSPSSPKPVASVMAEIRNRSKGNVHIFTDGETFGPGNRFESGNMKRVNVRVPSNNKITFYAGRNGQIIASKVWYYDPSHPDSIPVVIFDESNPYDKLSIMKGVR